YGNGEIQLATTDLSVSGFGLDFGHTRIFSNRLNGDFDFGNGYNWLVRDLPQLIEEDATTVLMLQGTRGAMWFDLVGGSYVGRYGTKFTLTHNESAGTFTLAAPNGQTIVFNDFNSANPGLFQSQTTAGGQILQVASYAPGTPLGIGEVQRSYTSGGTTTVESFLYSSTGDNLAGVLLRRQVAGGAWQNVRQVLYAYYGDGDPNGSFGDLQSATVQTWNAGAWQTINNYYYRDWTVDGGGGLWHGLKYVLSSASYDRMVAAGLNPLTATDAQLAGYADLYLEYDSDRHLTKEATNGGLYVTTFALVTNANPGYVDAYNNWKTKTVETRPDGSVNTVYANYVNDVLLKQLANGTDTWIEAVQFNGRGDPLQYAHPSAVVSFDDTQNDLAVVYRTNAGLIEKMTYYGSAAPGYLKSHSLQQGSAGTPVVQTEYTYTSVSARGTTVYPTTRVRQYRDDAGTQPLDTDLAYLFYPGTTAVQQRTTPSPIVPASQNGSGLAESVLEEFDAWGNTVATTDERGVVTESTVDIVTGGTLQRIDDAAGMALETDFVIDNLGRTTQSLGPAHTIDLNGIATLVRTARWFAYQDAIDQVWTAQGYAVGTAPNYTYTLVNPVSIAITDSDGNLTDQIQAIRASTAGPLLPTDSFPQSTWSRWTHNAWNDSDQLTATRVYFAIPASGSGTRGTNYNETDFGFDSMGRQNRVSNGGQTITRTVHDPRDLALSIWIGTNDNGATDNDPSGGGAPGNNMAAVTINQYDGGASGGDGNLTLQTKPVDGNSANNRTTAFAFDWRDRQVQITAAQDYYQVSTFDNLNNVIQIDQYSQATNNLIRRGATNYDNRGRAYQNLVYGVDVGTGAVGNVLTDNTWFDPVGNEIMTLPAGSKAFTKSVFDALNRETIEYVGFYAGGVPTYAQAVDISGATVVEQTETAFDEASNSIQTTVRQRFHDATGLGPLTYPGGPQPQARVTYTAMYPDAIGRNQATAEYGTNGDAPFTRSDTVPASSDTVHVSLTLYNDRGEPYQSVDPMGTVTQTTLDDAARRTDLVRNYQSGQRSTGDVNVTVQWAYTADDLTATMKALNAATGDQLTQFLYGTTVGTSDVARNDVISSTVYANGGTVTYLVNRQSERKQLTDQNGSVHVYSRDLLARPTFDGVPTLGTNTDGTIRGIGRTYEVRGLLRHITSFSDAAGTNVVNDVLRVYNSFEQPTAEYQEHSGAVNTSTSVVVGYQYADGSGNTTRETALVYPNGRTITLDYGTAGGIDDALSRVASLIDQDGTHLVDYTRIGAGTFVEQRSSQPQIAWSLINDSGIDPYSGLDQFNRHVDNRWFSTATNADLDRIQHGYDRAGNRLYRKNTVAEAAGVFLDELYAYDAMYRLARLDRGQLNSTNSSILSGTEDFTQAWGLDATGNWATFNQADSGGSWTLTQNRTSNPANEITAISGGGWAQPAYDAAGNMTQFPQPTAPAEANAATFDAWNRMILVSIAGSSIQQNAYDGENRRIASLLSGANRHFYFASEWRDVEERVGSSTMPDRQFVWGLRYVDELLVRDHSVERSYAMHDANWNITGIVSSNAAVAERYAYAAYGNPVFMDAAFVSQSTSPYSWERLFAGYHWDAASGLYPVRHRDFNFTLGVWEESDKLYTNQLDVDASVIKAWVWSAASAATAKAQKPTVIDPFLAARANLYAYCYDNPLVSTDPTGLQPSIPVPLPCSPAETAQCRTDCINDITIRTSKGRATLAASFCLKVVVGQICFTNCSCFYRTTVVSGHDRLCPNTCPPPIITIDRRSLLQPPQHGCPGDHWHYVPYIQRPFPDCRCFPGGRYFGGCLPQGAIIW
ncbi:MAG TPA: hypothetical protein PK867_06650, partial [Pirellulales bacterium]|nr:hypothetical protein [Pirellulales bacterium]